MKVIDVCIATARPMFFGGIPGAALGCALTPFLPVSWLILTPFPMLSAALSLFVLGMLAVAWAAKVSAVRTTKSFRDMPGAHEVYSAAVRANNKASAGVYVVAMFVTSIAHEVLK